MTRKSGVPRPPGLFNFKLASFASMQKLKSAHEWPLLELKTRSRFLSCHPKFFYENKSILQILCLKYKFRLDGLNVNKAWQKFSCLGQCWRHDIQRADIKQNAKWHSSEWQQSKGRSRTTPSRMILSRMTNNKMPHQNDTSRPAFSWETLSRMTLSTILPQECHLPKWLQHNARRRMTLT